MACTWDSLGFELGSANGADLLSLLDGSIGTTSGNLRKNGAGIGGARYWDMQRTSSTGYEKFLSLRYTLEEGWLRLPFRFTDPTCEMDIIFLNAAESEVFRINSSNLGAFQLYVNNTLVATSSMAFTEDTWYRFELYFKIDASGEITFRFDDVDELSYTGDTDGGGTEIKYLALKGNNDNVLIDDAKLNDPYDVLEYDGGAGTAPVAGDTITATGKTGTLIYHEGDGVTGRLILNTSDAFANNDALSNGSGWTANANGDINTSHSSWCGEGFCVGLVPTGAGATTGLTPSTGSNYAAVDDLETTTDYVSGATTGLYDTYAITDLDASWTDVKNVTACSFAQKSGSGIDHMRNVVRQSSTDYDSVEQHNLPSSYQWQKSVFYRNPSTLNPWSTTEVNNIQSGPKVET